MCHQLPSCCTDQWGPDCVTGYRAFAPACTAPGPEPAPSPVEITDARGQDARPLEAERVMLTVWVDLQPPPADGETGSVFYGGFRRVETGGRPPHGAMPDDYGLVDLRTGDFPVQTEAELITGLHYFAVFGTGAFPRPGDRMSDTVRLEPDMERLELVIGPGTIPPS